MEHAEIAKLGQTCWLQAFLTNNEKIKELMKKLKDELKIPYSIYDYRLKRVFYWLKWNYVLFVCTA